MQLSIPVNRRRIPTALLFYFAIGVIWAYLTIFPPIGGVMYQVLFGISLVALSLRVVVLLIDYGKTLLDKSAAINFTDEGVDDKRSIFSCGAIPWKRIAAVDLGHLRRMKFLVIRVDDPEGFVRMQPRWKRLFLNETMKRFGSPVVISQLWVRYDLTVLWESLQPYVAGRQITTS